MKVTITIKSKGSRDEIREETIRHIFGNQTERRARHTRSHVVHQVRRNTSSGSLTGIAHVLDRMRSRRDSNDGDCE